MSNKNCEVCGSESTNGCPYCGSLVCSDHSGLDHTCNTEGTLEFLKDRVTSLEIQIEELKALFEIKEEQND